MSLIKINYCQMVGDYIESPFSLDGIGFDPESLYDSMSKNAVYHKCPAWRHKATRTFLIKSPVDIDLFVDAENKHLTSKKLNQWQFDKYCSPTFLVSWCTPEKTTIQLTIPTFLFWTDKKNIWIESKPHCNTAVKNNIVSIPGWFNLSNWTRPITTVFDVIDVNKPIIINRGDPLFEISFFPNNLDDGILLKKGHPPDKILNKWKKTSEIKNYLKDHSKYFLFKKQKSKCPFEFLWK